MKRVLAIATLTWKAAFRFRLFLVLAVLLLASVVALPLLIKDDGTARGFTQILITYTLSTITALLGLSTLWLACGTLARDIEDCQIQVVATKPIARWQIWVGKWLGIMSLNAALLALSGASVFALLQYRATRLPADQQQVLRNEILLARGSAKPPSPSAEIEAEADKLLRERMEKMGPAAGQLTRNELLEVRKEIVEQVKATYQVVPPGYPRGWEIDLGSAAKSLRDKPLYLRVKFNSANQSPTGTFKLLWQAGVPQKTALWATNPEQPMDLAPDTFHEIQLPPGLIDDRGVLSVATLNMNNTTLLFTIEEGVEVLYYEGGFAMNFARGLGIIFCWMALLAAIGLASATFLSFPVAAFFALGLLTMVFSSGTMANAVTEGTIGGYDPEHGTKSGTIVDKIVLPVFAGALKVIALAKNFSPVDSLSTGRTITWAQLGTAFGQIVLLLGGIFALGGIWIFHRRELATAQGTQ